MKVIVVAPHPDDETLGCGGTLLRHISQGDEVHWLIVTEINEQLGYSNKVVECRRGEIDKVAGIYGFNKVHQLNFPATRLDVVPRTELVEEIGRIFLGVGPDIVYTVYHGDAHTDHKIVFEAVAACSKWFRFPMLQRVLAYETISETDIVMNLGGGAFSPNSFVDIGSTLEMKLKIMKTYGSEMGEFPFPRSEITIRALAAFRGSQAGFKAAEAFILIKERL